MIDSYESEVTVNLNNMTSQRLQQLEHVNAGYHKQLNDSEAEIQRLNQLLVEARHANIKVGFIKSLKLVDNVEVGARACWVITNS